MVITLSNVSFTHAEHYITKYYHSVDNREIRYGGNTQYSTAFNEAKNEWNNLGYVNMAPDTWYTWEDLTLKDKNKSQ